MNDQIEARADRVRQIVEGNFGRVLGRNGKSMLRDLPSEKRGLCHPCKPIVDAAIAARGC